MLHDDLWIYPDGESKPLGQSEHAEVVLRFMLKLTPEDRLDRRKLFDGLSQFTATQITRFKRSKVPPEFLAWLKERRDPRLYAMKYLNWIRVAKNTVNVWKFDDKTLDQIRASKFWERERAQDYEMLDFEELSTNDRFSVDIGKLKNPSAEAGALKNMAMGVGAFRNPEEKPDLVVGDYEIRFTDDDSGSITDTKHGKVFSLLIDDRKVGVPPGVPDEVLEAIVEYLEDKDY